MTLLLLTQEPRIAPQPPFGSLKYHQEGLLCAVARINPNCGSEYKCPLCCAIALAPGEGVWDLAKQIRGRTAPAKVLQCYLWTPRISNACAPFPLPSSPRARTRLLSVTGASLCGEVVTSGGKQWAVRGFRQACFKGLQKRSCRGGWGRA